MLPARLSRSFSHLTRTRQPLLRTPRTARWLHSSPALCAVKPFILADIGEGIRECEVIQWFVEPGARVEEFDKLCEVQSDKASVEITSRYEGVVKALHYQSGDMAIVGKPLCDIDVLDDGAPEDAPLEVEVPRAVEDRAAAPTPTPTPTNDGPHRALATPAVRRICREHGVAITEVAGTGKGGRVLKEDVERHLKTRDSAPTGERSATDPFPPSPAPTVPGSTPAAPARPAAPSTAYTETPAPLTPIQAQMFKAMTRSLNIPHFLYNDDVEFDALGALRAQLNAKNTERRLTYMPFIIKAVSAALEEFPLLNSRVDVSGAKPQLITRSHHNIGVAMDTPLGLIVPNIKNVQALSIAEIAEELARLQEAGKNGRLTPADLSGGTITVSNIGNIGGRTVAPVLVESEVAILGVTKARRVPMFNERDEVVPKTLVGFSWSADHRVVDGATMARMADRVKAYLEEPGRLLVKLR